MQLTSRPARVAYPRRRPGFTLVEMLVVMVLLTIIGGSLMGVLAKQQRFYQGTADLGDLRSQLRQAEAVMSNDLRGLSSVGADITAMTDSSIDFNYTIGSSIACAKPGTTITLPPSTLANGTTLTTWIQAPQVGDKVYVFDDGASTATSLDDTWQPYTIAGIDSTTGGCASYTTAPDAASYSWVITLNSTASATIQAGAVVRFVRPAHYSLYKSTGDNLWYLGYTCPTCSTGATILPVAGPFMPYLAPATPDTSGIRITYFDSTNTATTTVGNVARINVVLRGQTRGYLNISGLKRGFYTDSVRMDIAVRNRS
jgi:prepilin-type N-terminal cleavage/methylation domain-containing protein